MVTVYELVDQFAIKKQLGPLQIAELRSVFGFLEDGTDLAAKILIPLCIAYCDLAGPKSASVLITDGKVLEIKLKSQVLSDSVPSIVGKL